MLQSRHTRIGVDVGTTGVRAVQLLYQRGTFVVRSVAHSERSMGRTEQNGPLLERRLDACLRAGQFQGRDVTVGTQAGQVEYHLLELPGAIVAKANVETDQAVRWEVGSLMGEAVDKIQSRYWTVPPPATPGPNALAVGVRDDVVRTTFDACTKVGAVCRSIDVPAAAMCRVSCALREITDRSIWGILDLGYEQSRLVVCVEETPVLVRAVGTGGAQWTQRIAEALGISPKAAEVHKCEHGIARRNALVADKLAGDASSTELASILYGALRSDLMALATETDRSFQYVAGCYAGREIRDVVLMGGGANLNGLDKFLNQQMGLDVRRVSDFLTEQTCGVQFSSGRGDSFEKLALATGLAIPA